MRYRQLGPTGDYQFGLGTANFLIDDAQCVVQKIQTRLRLNQGDWFLDTTAGVPWNTKVLGKSSANTRDMVLKSVILGTDGVTGLVPNTWSATLTGRQLTVSCSVTTIYSAEPIVVAAVI
jgi:hypothetical protein